MAHSIGIESTPNPATLKFKFPKQLLETSYEFLSANEAESSPLAAKLFGFPWTSAVFLGPDFVSVTKQDWVDWEVLAEPLANLIGEHLERGEPLVVELKELDNSPDDSPIVQQIKLILNQQIRPLVAMDGGDVTFAKYEDSILYLRMQGACSGCPSSQATLKEGIEVRFRELLPEIKQVLSIN